MYKISVFNRTEIVKIREVWIALEKGGEMTYFQSFYWNRMLLGFTPNDNVYHEVVYCLVTDKEEQPILIAPLWIVKSTFRILNKRGVYLIGRLGWSDYLNFVYKDFDSHAVAFLFHWLKGTYHTRLFVFEQLKTDCSLHRYIVNTYHVKKSISTPCVHLPLPGSVEEYQKMLSKSSRQNLRTAHNRLQKDGHFISFDFKGRPDLEICKQMRALRVAKKKERDLTLWKKIKGYIVKSLILNFPSYLPFYEDTQSRFITAYIDGEFCAYFNYGLDREHDEIVVMAVGTSEKYAKYSPGVLLLYEYIKYQILNKGIKTIDLTRGDEKYKYALGGVNHFIQTVNFEL